MVDDLEQQVGSARCRLARVTTEREIRSKLRRLLPSTQLRPLKNKKDRRKATVGLHRIGLHDDLVTVDLDDREGVDPLPARLRRLFCGEPLSLPGDKIAESLAANWSPEMLWLGDVWRRFRFQLPCRCRFSIPLTSKGCGEAETRLELATALTNQGHAHNWPLNLPLCFRQEPPCAMRQRHGQC